MRHNASLAMHTVRVTIETSHIIGRCQSAAEIAHMFDLAEWFMSKR